LYSTSEVCSVEEVGRIPSFTSHLRFLAAGQAAHMPPVSIFAECLQVADSLGLSLDQACRASLTSEECRPEAEVEAAAMAASMYKDIYDVQLAVLEQEDFSAWESITAHATLDRRTAQLTSAARTLSTVLDGKEGISKRLRSASIVPSIPVEPRHQPDLSALLQHAAGGQAILAHGRDALEWAASFQERPSCWEDRLATLPEALKAARQHAAALQQFATALEARQ
jgi:HAUS augmin-like complex subunit 2